MIDAPIIAAAHRTIRLAQVSGVQVAGGVR